MAFARVVTETKPANQMSIRPMTLSSAYSTLLLPAY